MSFDDLLRDEQRNFRVLLLDSGPSAGKTTAITALQEALPEHGIRVIAGHEAATHFISGGGQDIGQLAVCNRAAYVAAQEAIFDEALAVQAGRVRYAAARAPEPTLVVLDRGPAGCRGFLTEIEYSEILARRDLTHTALLGAYDAVAHMVTAADGAEEFYTLENNLARRETPEEARESDARIKKIYLSHPHLRVVDNSTDFEAKVRKVVDLALSLFGVPTRREYEGKFLLTGPVDPRSLGVPVETIDIVQHYLSPADSPREDRVRRRVWRGEAAHFATRKIRPAHGAPEEFESAISEREYLHALDARAAPQVRKRRHCFVYKSSFCELDEVLLDDGGPPPGCWRSNGYERAT